MLKTLEEIFNEVIASLNVPLLTIGNATITVWQVIYLLFALVVIIFIGSRLKKWLVNNILIKTSLDIGARIAIGTITKYFFILGGLVVIVQSVGVDLSTLTVVAGALGVGIGFGLQNVTNNFVSGVIIIFERPIKVGDRIEVGDLFGDVVKISIRATTILTNDNISVIVPNSEFISSRVINWSHTDRNVRFNFPVGVSYKEDPDKVRKILLDIARSNPDVLKHPEPDVIFEEFGESSLNFTLRVWTTKYIQTPKVLKSILYFEIFNRFRKSGIEIPFPQRDLHIKNNELKVTSAINSGE